MFNFLVSNIINLNKKQKRKRKRKHYLCFSQIRWSIFFISLFTSSPSLALPLSPGDRLEVSIPDDKYFARAYEVNQNGAIEVPFLGSISVVGLEPAEVENKLAWLLIDQKYFLADNLALSIQVLSWSPINVTLTGEVFQPGRVSINEKPEENDPTAISPETLQITGDNPSRRYLTDALRAAGGVLPTANVKDIRLIRQNQEIVIDLSGVFSGETVEDIPLIAGDRIIVPATTFQAQLARPSQITPPGIKVFASNLIVPALNNASAAISNREEGIVFPYGSRFSQAVIAVNCAGGTKSTNAKRKAILVRVNRLTGETTYLESEIEELLRNSTNEAENPLLLPRDGVACYDSNITNTRDVFKSITDIILSPFLLFRNLF